MTVNERLEEGEEIQIHSITIREEYCTKVIKARLANAKAAFRKKRALLTRKLNLMLRKKLLDQRRRHCERFIWRVLRCDAGGEWKKNQMDEQSKNEQSRRCCDETSRKGPY